MKIYLDTCCFNRPLDEQSNLEIQLETFAKLNIQEKIRKGDYELVWSYMLNLENNVNPNMDKRLSVQLWEHIAKEYCEPSNSILSKGRKIEKFNIKSKDALHIACAISKNCEFFITCDKNLLKKEINEIQIINPIDFVRKEVNP